MTIFWELYIGKGQEDTQKPTAAEQLLRASNYTVIQKNKFFAPLDLKIATNNETLLLYKKYPPTVIVSAQFDMLKDEAHLFYQYLTNSTIGMNVKHEYLEMPGTCHSFLITPSSFSTQIKKTVEYIIERLN